MIALFERASFMAQGKSKTKLFKRESFLLEQKICGAVVVAAIVLSALSNRQYFTYLSIVNAIILALFYLQPTPRTTKKLNIMFILINAIFLALIVF